MASNPPGDCCIVGVKHEGTATGQKVLVAGKHEGYLAVPPADKEHKDIALLIVPDVFGIWINSQLMADQFAANGYKTLLLDVFDGDALDPNKPLNIDIMAWFAGGSDGKHPHTKEAVDPIVVDALKDLKEKYGAKKIGGLGYCFGAKYVARHYKDGIDVGYFAHPSFVDEDELAAITGPLSIAAAEIDTIFPEDKRLKSDEILKNSGLPYEIVLYPGVEHGFSVRGDVSVPLQKESKEKAFVQAVSWFNKHLA
ncbi:alpha/beta-hydrolase [Thozetella sp. PMI_491]|nr:alpha/beta-hydrolase [Thozetella sp. PMI_491]